MAPDSTASEQPVDKSTPKPSLVLRTAPYLVELSLNSVMEGQPFEYRLSIEAPTLEAVRGIFPGASARLFDIVSQAQSNGGSQDQDRG